MAIHLRPVRIVKPAALGRQKLQLGRAAALFFPVNALKRAAPSFGRKYRETRLYKGTVKPGVMRHHQIGRLHQGVHGRVVDALALHHAVVNAGDFGDLGWNRPARVFEGFINRDRPHRQTRGGIDQHQQHGQLNDFFAFAVQPGGFGVEHDHALSGLPVHRPIVGARHQTPQNTKVGVLRQGLGHGFRVAGLRQQGCSCGSLWQRHVLKVHGLRNHRNDLGSYHRLGRRADRL